MPTRGAIFSRARGEGKSVIWNMHRQMGLVFLSFLIVVSMTGAYYAFRDTFLKSIHALTGSLPPRGSPPVAPPTDGSTPPSLDDIATAARAETVINSGWRRRSVGLARARALGVVIASATQPPGVECSTWSPNDLEQFNE